MRETKSSCFWFMPFPVGTRRYQLTASHPGDCRSSGSSQSAQADQIWLFEVERT
jgi:hypothetical protein